MAFVPHYELTPGYWYVRHISRHPYDIVLVHGDCLQAYVFDEIFPKPIQDFSYDAFIGPVPSPL